MMEAFYIVLVTLFGSLTILALVTGTGRTSAVREKLLAASETAERLEQRIHKMRLELQEDEFNIGMCDEEKRELEELKTCLLALEEEHRAEQATALAAVGAQDKE